MNAKQILRNPFNWFISFLIIFSFVRLTKMDELRNVIYSDGKGYYAYLPSLLIHHDENFEKTRQAEKKYFGFDDLQLYLHKDRNGKTYDKYFPGLAILQLPFFVIACGISWISGQPITGYSDVFLFCFYLGSLFYSVLGMILFSRCLRDLFPNQGKALQWLIPILYISTPLFFYAINIPCLSHLYSFFLFGCFARLVLRLKNTVSWKDLFLLGIVVGMIFLVRPTNGVVVLILPVLLGSKSEVIRVFKEILQSKMYGIPVTIIGFLIPLGILFGVWKWQTGSWILWSYSGEGFNFLSPHIYEHLFSFRIGLFWQIPIMILVFTGWIYFFKENKFAALFWFIYFAINLWIFSSWWCWDFESAFGSRPYTEHLFFLLIPVIFLFEKHRKITWEDC